MKTENGFNHIDKTTKRIFSDIISIYKWNSRDKNKFKIIIYPSIKFGVINQLLQYASKNTDIWKMSMKMNMHF
jgi:hypothetical protein